MNTGIQKACVWSGVIGIFVFFVGLLTAQMVPPPSPSLPMDEVIAIYTSNANFIRVGFLLCLLSTIFVLPFFGLISIYLRRIENRDFPIFSYTQLIGAAVNGAAFVFPPAFMLVMAFRPDRMPEITYLMYDMSWFMLILLFPGNFVQCIAISFCIFADKRDQPLLPRWVGYLNLWVAIGFFPAVTLVFYKSGPFSWNGLFPFWIPATVFGAWFIVMAIVLLKAINRETLEYKPTQ